MEALPHGEAANLMDGGVFPNFQIHSHAQMVQIYLKRTSLLQTYGFHL